MHNRLVHDTRKIRFHEVVDGEIALVDESVVLELVLHRSIGMIVYDRSRRLAAASKISISGKSSRSSAVRESAGSASLALLARLCRLGCSLDHLEVYALGAPFPPPGAGSASSVLHVDLAMALPFAPGVRRVEFDVAIGRIVIEGPPLAGR